MSTVTVRDCEFSYRLAGSGPDIVWGHGLSSSMAEEDDLGFVDWAQLDGNYRVLRYDARGHGESGSTSNLEGYSWENLARDQLALALGWTGDATHPLTTTARLQELMPHAELAIATTRAGMAAWTRRIGNFLARSLSDR
jgi:predicted alpha/beta hydrolase